MNTLALLLCILSQAKPATAQPTAYPAAQPGAQSAAQPAAQPPEEPLVEPLKIGVYMPWVFFVDTEQQATTLSNIEKALSETLGRPVVGSFTSASNLSDFDFLLIDAVVAASRDHLRIVSHGRLRGRSDAPVAIFARRGGTPIDRLLRSKKLALPGPGGSTDAALVRYWLLLDEPNAGTIASRLAASRDARSAMTSAAHDVVDLTFALRSDAAAHDPNLTSLKELTWLRYLPLPVLAINLKKVKASEVDSFAAKLARTKLPHIPATVDSWAAGAPESFSSLRSTLRHATSPISRAPALAPLAPLHLDLTAQLPAAPPPPQLDMRDYVPAPTFPNDLPDPPSPATSPAPVASLD